MDYRSAYINRRKKTSRLTRRVGLVAVVGCASCAALVLLLAREPDLNPAAVTAMAAAPGMVAPTPDADARRIYRYSVVPGGVSSRDEIARAIKTDKVVAAHYAVFDVDKASKLTVTKARAVYVSYRKGDKVYWTARKVALVPGETVLSDGRSEIRGRCGNRISLVPQLPVEASGPTPEELDSTVMQAQEAPDQLALVDAGFALDDMSNPVRPASQTGQPAGFAKTAARVQASSERLWTDGVFSIGLSDQFASLRSSLGDTQIVRVSAPAGTVSNGDSQPGNAPTDSTTSTATGTVPASTQDPGTGGDPGSSAPPGGTPGPGPSPGPQTTVHTKDAAGQRAVELPEPGSLWLFGAAFAAMMLLRRNKAAHRPM